MAKRARRKREGSVLVASVLKRGGRGDRQPGVGLPGGTLLEGKGRCRKKTTPEEERENSGAQSVGHLEPYMGFPIVKTLQAREKGRVSGGNTGDRALTLERMRIVKPKMGSPIPYLIVKEER